MARPPRATGNSPSSVHPRDGRTAFEDLPPDRQAEILGQRQARSDRRRNTYRPKAPAISAPIEIHTAEIQLAYTRWFAACNEYAVAIDYVARERLTDRADYNRYLDEFDAALNELSETALGLYTRYEGLSNGGKANSPVPSKIDARIQSKRSMQLLQMFRQCDDILRMISFLSIYGDLPEKQAASDTARVTNSLNTCLKALRKVKVNCFRRIIEAEALTAKAADKMTVEDLEAARKNAGIKDATLRRRRRKAAPVLNPGAPASEPVPGTTESTAEPAPDAPPVEMPEAPADSAARTAAE